MTLKGKLIALTVSLFIAFIWALALFSATILQNQLEHVLSDQQFASAQRLAADIDSKLKERVEGLTHAAARLPAELSSQALQDHLAQLDILRSYFSGGLAVIGLDGRTIADYPVAPGRSGAYFGDRDYFRHVMASEKPHIDKPIIGRALKRPVLTIGAPVFDGEGKIRAVMTGIIDLTAPNFLGVVSDRSFMGKGEFFIFSLNDNIIIAATDGKRVMTAPPPQGANLMYDRLVNGFEGSGLAVSSEGIRKLYSGKSIPSVNWLVLAALPTDVVFGPVTVMRQYLYAAAAIMTLLAVLILRWMARGMLAPLEEAGRAMRQMTGGQTALAELPVGHDDEVGQLIASFNLLVRDRRGHEAALAESEQRFRMLVESAPDAILVETEGRFTYLNAAAHEIFGL
ncbi:MAG: PAS domain S-box protein, partial [Rhodospirillales bacterium]|nr:PAS domain S-box protein [Rhodospirillales bacterium]